MEEKGREKAHRKRQAGPKAAKKKSKSDHEQELTAQQRNPRAFSIQHAKKALKTVQRTQDLKTKKQHIPVVDRTPDEPPPIIVGVVGPPKVGKTTLLRCVVKNFTRQRLTKIQGPVTVVSGKQRRLTLIECNNDICSMIDIAKVADLVLLLVDASFGFEMETFEFLNICQVHGFPRIMGVLTHLDTFRDSKRLRKTKKRLKHRFWTEGAKLFYLSGMVNEEYQKTEVHNLCRFISVMKFRPLVWRTTHPYILADRMEDITDPETVRQRKKADRNISLYGYLHGTHMKNNINVHIPGCGDFPVHDIQFLSDPCPTPNRNKEKRRTLSDRERMIYAPMSGVGGIVYDKDAVYIDLGGSHSHHEPQKPDDESEPINELVSSLMGLSNPLDEKMTNSEVALYSQGIQRGAGHRAPQLETVEMESGRVRRRAMFEGDKVDDEDNDDSESGDSSDDDDDDDDDDGDQEEEKDVREIKKLKQIPKGKKFDQEEEDLAFADTDDELNPSDFHPNIKSKAEKSIKSTDNDSSSESDSEEMHVDKGNTAAKTTVQTESDLDDSESSESDSNASDSDMDAEEVQTADFKKVAKKSSASNKTGNFVSNTSKLQKTQTSSSADKTKKSIHSADSKTQMLSDLDSKSGVNKYDSDESELSSEEEMENDDSEDNLKVSEKSDMETSETLNVKERKDIENANMKGMYTKTSDSGVNKAGDGNDVRSKLLQLSKETYTRELTVERKESFRWKSDLAGQAASNFRQRQADRINYRKLIYGKDEEEERPEGEDEDEIGGLFRVLKQKSEAQTNSRLSINSTDCTKCHVHNASVDAVEQLREMIADCFVTGKWEENQDAAALLEKDDEMYGDFEDLETGESHTGAEPPVAGSSNDNEGGDEQGDNTGEEEKPVPKKKSEMSGEERRAEKKRKLKEMFDTTYDMKGDTEFYDNWKEEMANQAKMNKSVFEDMEDDLRVQYEGFRAGMYVRVEIHGVPCEFVTNFDPSYPLIIGGLLSVENNVGYVQTRFKKHRWHKRILKNQNPLIFSLGWRRFQSMPLYSIQDHNMRNRLLKYTPEHMHCQASFWGPITPQGTGLLAVENVAQADFRIAGTGVILELDKSMQIVKKLKLTGTPLKIYKKTAFIQGMFNSTLEVAKFEGASIRTVSGIRGQIKKAAKTPEGAYRATFEDKILLSDIVFLRTWFPVEVPQFYNPVTSLLLPHDQKHTWTGLKTVGQLRREKNVKAKFSTDSIYKTVERKSRTYTPLSIPKSLQKTLPFKDTPKVIAAQKDTVKRVAIIREPHEAKVDKMVSMLRKLHEHKNRTQHQNMRERASKHQKIREKSDGARMQRQKEVKKNVFRMLGKMEKRKNKHNRD
ncbi:BMS1-like protein [Mya arenaria]|uniref:BMS1-like protein n=1 Tax=Mya arenaria TaxID=6604 RepID=A0ABY7DI43_MYAAR|nr:BMS1-like protein [Mya arenaria]